MRTSALPLMLTGGVARRPVAEEVLASGVELVGMGSALAVDPGLPARWRHDRDAKVDLRPIRIADKAVASAASMARVRRQLRRLGAGRPTKPGIDPKPALVVETVLQAVALRRYRTWLRGRAG
ncbi:hypothetical protein [Amycolatopsis sp. cmx-4-54]|uniref:hypothetical protein n=1 Tax=Amycolatopsis sp. cmx-4-54 TaxID=2790936 RepID=UPI00397D5CA1